MIVSPSPSELLRSVRHALDATVAPGIVDPHALAALAQAGLVLRSIEVTIDHELVWLREEITDIRATAKKMIALGADSDGRIAAALTNSTGDQGQPLDLPTERAHYQRASEVLSRCLEVAVPAGGRAQELATAALERRIARERSIKTAAQLDYANRTQSQEQSK